MNIFQGRRWSRPSARGLAGGARATRRGLAAVGVGGLLLGVAACGGSGGSVLAASTSSTTHSTASTSTTTAPPTTPSTTAPPPTTASTTTAPPTTAPTTTAPTTTAPTTTGAALPTVDTQFGADYMPAVKPSTIYLSGDSTNIVTGLRWAGWDGHGATGYGTVDVLSCVPDCAQGSSTPTPVTIYLNNPVNGAFSLLTEIIKGMAAQNFTVPTS